LEVTAPRQFRPELFAELFATIVFWRTDEPRLMTPPPPYLLLFPLIVLLLIVSVPMARL